MLMSLGIGFVVLSGGGSPSINHYSQYLQTRSLSEDLTLRFGRDRVSVGFGAGNLSGEGAGFPDVVKRDLQVDSSGRPRETQVLLSGEIPGNHEASKEWLRDALHQKSRADQSLFLLVSDHGAPEVALPGQIQTYQNNRIQLWGLHPETRRPLKEADRFYTREEMESDLSALPSKRIIYGMTQCYSGGFHYLSVKPESNGKVKVDPRVCGVTASTPDLTASGCSDHVDGPMYAGYERFLTKHLIGRDFVTGVETPGGRAKTLHEAHLLADLDDFTDDLPQASSDFYLSEIYNQSRIFGFNRNFSGKVSDQEVLNRIVVASNPFTGSARIQDAEYENRANHLKAWIEQASRNGFKDASTLGNADLTDLEKQVDALELATRDLDEEVQYRGAISLELTDSILSCSPSKSAIEDFLTRNGLGEYASRLGSMEKRDFMNFEMPGITRSQPEDARKIALFFSMREDLARDAVRMGADGDASSLLMKKLEKERKADASFTAIRDQHQKSDQRYRFLRRLLTMRRTLGVLGAALELQESGREIVKNHSDLRVCEDTPISDGAI